MTSNVSRKTFSENIQRLENVSKTLPDVYRGLHNHSTVGMFKKILTPEFVDGIIFFYNRNKIVKVYDLYTHIEDYSRLYQLGDFFSNKPQDGREEHYHKIISIIDDVISKKEN